MLAHGLKMIDDEGVLVEMADDATRVRIAADRSKPTKDAIAEALDRLNSEHARALEQNRKGWYSDSDTETAIGRCR